MYKFITDGGNTFEVKEGRLALLSDDGVTPAFGRTGRHAVRWIEYPEPGKIAVYRFPGTNNVHYIGVVEVLRDQDV